MDVISYEQLCRRLVVAVPEFDPIYRENLEDQRGEELQHVVFGDFTRFVEQAAEGEDWVLVDRCLAFLEQVLAGGDPLAEGVVAVSFVENLMPWEGTNAAICERFPRLLEAELEKQRQPPLG